VLPNPINDNGLARFVPELRSGAHDPGFVPGRIMTRSHALDELLDLPDAEVERLLASDGPLEVALPGSGPTRAVLSGNGDGYDAQIWLNGTRVAGVTCADVPTLLRFMRQSRL
jgi:hypothetical protein